MTLENQDPKTATERRQFTDKTRPLGDRTATASSRLWAAGLLLVALALVACESEPELRTPVLEGFPVAPSSPSKPSPQKTVNAEILLPRLSLKQVRRNVAADGRIDRREAIRLAIRNRKPRSIKRTEARRADELWIVKIIQEDGCRYVHRIDSRSGDNRGGSIVCH